MAKKLFLLAIVIPLFASLVAGRCTDQRDVVIRNLRTYARGSVYGSNLNLLFDRLITTTGYDHVGSGSNRVYGFSECYGSPNCRSCLLAAVNSIRSAAPRAIGARICKALCYLRYENYRI
ncbi:hypothetical protein SELMODRAFT_424271 [Selaginella moellendorffii]|uniref:Gnk2-homologous domain-containing protein n=1 Tax=Selaginella moellendorffii TaxID=88036 RepID=D8SPC5_SELML|nr:hypothetical protein SELMODRAFT_424271 [Selaginella moellendorffii]